MSVGWATAPRLQLKAVMRIVIAVFALLLPAGAFADSRFEPPRVTALRAAPDSSEVVLVDEASGRRARLEVGERYAGAYRVVEVERDRAVLRRLGSEAVYFVLPIRGRANAPRAGDPSELDLLDPYAPNRVRSVLAPRRARAGHAPANPYDRPARRDAAPDTPRRQTDEPRLKNPYDRPARRDAAPDAPRRQTDEPRLKNPYDRPDHGDSGPQPRPVSGGSDARTPARDRPAPDARGSRDRDIGPETRTHAVSRARLDEALGNFGALEKQVALRAEGDAVRIASLQTGSFLYELGLRRGDLIERVAGRRVDSAQAAAALYAHVAHADTIAVELERSGRELVLRYRITP